MKVLEKIRLDGKVAIVTGAGRGLGREMALALAGAGAERHADEVALQVVGPLVIDTLMTEAITARFAADDRTTVGTAVHERVQSAFFVTGDHNRGVPDECGLEIPGFGYFRFQADIIPGVAAKDAFLFLRVNGGIEKRTIRNSTDPLDRPRCRNTLFSRC